MRKFRHAARHLILVALLSLTPIIRATEIVGTVIGVADGDTITVLTSAKDRVRVRLYGIDAPESHQAFGTVAKKALSERIFRKMVRIDVVSRDRFGRTVGRVFFGDDDIGLGQVRGGFAWWYAHFAANDEALRDAEAEARKSKSGLWSEPSPVPRGSGGERRLILTPEAPENL